MDTPRFGASLFAIALAGMGGMTAPARAQQTAAPVATATPPVMAAPRPNVLVWMLDDVGFAQLSSYGGLVETPNIDRVAQSGLRYTNYHTAPICSASRAALLTGRNPHSVHVGGHSGAPLPFPGYDGIVPAEDGTIAANLKQAGYRTFALGKWDHLPNGDMTPAGPFTRWPTGQGFDKFYGFIGADTDNWTPALISGTQAVPRPDDPAYHLNHDLANRAIDMIGARNAREPLAPFFLYFATGTAHAPHHAPQAWIDRYQGKFDMGWDKVREAVLKREIAQGLIPKGTKLAPRPEGMPAWDSLSAEDMRLYARQMEVFAASLSYADAEFGRVLDALEQSGELDNTIVVVTSDNGASAEGAHNGTYNETLFMAGHYPTADENRPFLDRWGGPETQPHYAFGWAVAGNTPFRYFKQTTYEGGIRVPLILSWPKGIAARGELRRQFVNVDDVAPTLLDLTGVTLAPVINDVPQTPMEGMSFRYSLAAADAADRKGAQYFEMYGNKGLWSDGWSIVTAHRMDPWRMDQTGPITEAWELYDLTRDPGQTVNLAGQYPDRVTAMAAAFDAQARQYNVYPLSNFGDSRAFAMKEMQGEMMRRKGKWTYPVPVSHIGYGATPPLSVRPYAMTAHVGIATGTETGPIFALGGSMGGMGLYLEKGVPTFALRDLAGNQITVKAPAPLAAGETDLTLTIERPALRPMTPEPVIVTIAAGGQTLVRQQVEAAIPIVYGISEPFDIGIDWGSAVSPAYPAERAFPGTIGKVEFTIR
ncbi:arylsulfatase [Sphingomonas sp. 37zxx]|uniref:arylsulfatase n=1 Tax=Sphingomonas sp. 37zxx TaxID=1550073 RepID=UPI00069056D3|nr:arylsulfatase [Sphingomonas sp. 37zxx]